jgi:hypothetical protein
MLLGKAIVAIWTTVRPEAKAGFYDWLMNEHMPERVGLPGFQRGRRYHALRDDTRPEYFNFYEVDTMDVLSGPAYNERLNNPTPWTRMMMGVSLETFRALARVEASYGPGVGGVMLTIRFDLETERLPDIKALVDAAARAPRVAGAHLCLADDAASAARTTETRGRADMQAPPRCFVMVEATDAEALTDILSVNVLSEAGACGSVARGIYRLEYARTKLDVAL